MKEILMEELIRDYEGKRYGINIVLGGGMDKFVDEARRLMERRGIFNGRMNNNALMEKILMQWVFAAKGYIPVKMVTNYAKDVVHDIWQLYGIKVLFNRDVAFIQTDRYHLEEILKKLDLKYCNDWDRKKHCDVYILSIG